MRIKKTSQYIQDGVILPSYFTDEIDTGMKWIDDKPIYRKVFSISYPSGSTTASESTGITNLDNVIKLESVIKKTYTGYNDFENGNYYASGSATGRIFYRTQNNTIEIRTSATSVNSTYYVILEYTKTS